jgi:hypothetical protein
MSIIINFDNEKQLTTHTVIGEATGEEILSALRQFWEDRPTINEIWDFREAIGTGVKSEDVDTIMDYIRHHSEKRAGGRTAFIVAGDLEYGMSRMAQAQSVIESFPFQVEIFRSIEAAREWFALKE